MGLAGDRHLQAQLDLGNSTGVYTRNPQKRDLLRRRKGVIVFDDLKTAIDWSSLVHVCTSDNMHAKYITLALEQSKAVLCEKPFTTTLQEALNLQNLAHRCNSILVVGQNYRLTPSFLEIRKLVQGGSIGVITGIETTYLHDMTEYRMGTVERNTQDFLYVGGSHAVDLACWIINQPVVRVQANIGTKIRDEYTSQERYRIILKFASGILGHVSLDASSARLIHGSDVVVDGEKGYLVSHNKVDNLIFYKKGDKKTKSLKLANRQIRTIDREVKILNDFLKGNTDSYWPLPGVDEAVKIIKILDATQRAVLSGQSELIS